MSAICIRKRTVAFEFLCVCLALRLHVFVWLTSAFPLYSQLDPQVETQEKGEVTEIGKQWKF